MPGVFGGYRIMMEATTTVGNHHVNGKQAHIPTEILNELGADNGDTIEFTAVENGCIVTVINHD